MSDFGTELSPNDAPALPMWIDGRAYLLGYGLPQFFFHVSTSYALLRHNGVDVGKRDYMGAY